MRADRKPLHHLHESNTHARPEHSEEAASFGDLGPPGARVVYSVVDGAPSGIAESTARRGRQEGIDAAPCSHPRLDPISSALAPAAVGMPPDPWCPLAMGWPAYFHRSVASPNCAV